MPDDAYSDGRGGACSSRTAAAETLLDELARLRLRPGPAAAGTRPLAGGVGLRVPVLHTGAEEMVLLGERLALLRRAGIQVTLTLTDLGRDAEACAVLEDFCGRLASALAGHGILPRGLGTAVHTHVLPLPAYLVICGALLGRGPRWVLLDRLQMDAPADVRAKEAAKRNWMLLWRHSDVPPVLLPAYASAVGTRCPLLGDEAAQSVLPGSGLQVPAETAWLPLRLYLPDFSDGRGRLAGEELQKALERALPIADALIDRLDWPLPALARDALANRRIAFAVDGIGDLVAERGISPQDLRCLEWVDAILAEIAAALWNRSRQLARQKGPLPALLHGDPSSSADHAERPRWRARWRRAVASAAVRNRNLLAVSPYALLPRGLRSAAGYADLLPVLRHADLCAFGPPPPAAFDSRADYVLFHRRAFAVTDRRNSASLVAADV